jgi:hypothetical protein
LTLATSSRHHLGLAAVRPVGRQRGRGAAQCRPGHPHLPAAAEGSGPVSFIVGPHQAIVRPLDNVPGYVVPMAVPPVSLGVPLPGVTQIDMRPPG